VVQAFKHSYWMSTALKCEARQQYAPETMAANVHATVRKTAVWKYWWMKAFRTMGDQA
jgi:hypothetical protein